MPPLPDDQTLPLILSGRLHELDWASYTAAGWESLVQAARREGVAPLVYRAFSKADRLPSLPPETRNVLRALYASTLMQNQHNFKELETLSQRFAQAGIPVVVLKGACFALTIYPEPGLRPMGDVDVLVPASQLAEAVQIATDLGYERTEPEASPGLQDLLNHEVCLHKPGPFPVTLEIHKSLVADKTFTYAVPVDWFWEQTEPLQASSAFQFEGLRMLTPAAQVLYAAGHAMLQHGGQRSPLRWFYDLDLLIRHDRNRLDWDLLLSQARIFEWGAALEAALSQAGAYFGTPIPEPVRARLAAQSDRHQPLVALKQTRPATHIQDEFQKLASLNGYGKFRLILALIAPSPAYMRWRYQLKHGWQVPLYYFVRWWGILKDAFRTLIVLVKRPTASRPH